MFDADVPSAHHCATGLLVDLVVDLAQVDAKVIARDVQDALEL
jgi:hypothetical protein